MSVENSIHVKNDCNLVVDSVNMRFILTCYDLYMLLRVAVSIVSRNLLRLFFYLCWPILQNYFTSRLSSEFVVGWQLKIPSFLKHVATLPCEMFVCKKSPCSRIQKHLNRSAIQDQLFETVIEQGKQLRPGAPASRTRSHCH